MNHWVKPTKTRRLTPLEVLERIQAFEWYRQRFGSGKPPRSVTFKTPLREWADIDDSLDFFDFSLTLEELFGCSFEGEEDVVTLFTDDASIGHLCERVAGRSSVEVVEPLRIAGTESLPAGAFLTMLHLLETAGVDTNRISPSEPLGPWLVRSSHQFTTGLIRCFARRLPEMEFYQHPLSRAGSAMCVREFLMFTIAGVIALWNKEFWMLAPSLFGLGFGTGSYILGERICPTHTRFVEEMTFGDLARLLVGDSHCFAS